jgi:hypothetical protein
MLARDDKQKHGLTRLCRRCDHNALHAALAPPSSGTGYARARPATAQTRSSLASLAARDEGYDIDALELIPAPTHVVLGARPGLEEVAGVPLHGEIYDVFSITDGTVTRIEDYAERADALTAAGPTGN